MSENQPVIHRATVGGIAADHLPVPGPQALVAPTVLATEHNTLRSSLVPFACWRTNDMRFEFESSFVLPEISHEIEALKELIDRHTLPDAEGHPKCKPTLSVFGHADPIGNDDFNKLLSGRRAQAIYGMLTRKVDLWEDLYSHPLGNDRWEPKAIRAMQTTLEQPTSDHPSASARKALFKAYMDRVCAVRDNSGQLIPFVLQTTDFLAGGKDSNGKGDYQGCGEFNPVLVFSNDETRQFSDPKKAPQRNSENGANRRVLVYLFRPGVTVDPDSWPCPRVKEGVGACRKRFWSDGEKRRNPQKERRQFEITADTFACRFYHRLSTNSPCERGGALWIVYWITQAPEARGQGEVMLVIKDEEGSEITRLSAADARPGPGEFLTFDLSSVDRNRNLRLELQAGGRDLGTRFGLSSGSLFGSLAAGDLTGLSAQFFRVGSNVSPPVTPTPPPVDATGAQYQELRPEQPGLVT